VGTENEVIRFDMEVETTFVAIMLTGAKAFATDVPFSKLDASISGGV
jgi:hypothetical protein